MDIRAVSRGDAGWKRAVEEHRDAVRRFVATAEGLGSDAWTRPRAPGQWTPAEIAEHLVLSYETALRELAGGPGIRPRATGWRQRLLRWVLLPHILFHRRFPVRAVAPREIRPTGAHGDRGAVLARMRELAARAERELDAARGTGALVTHPYFGGLPAVRTLRFLAIHIEHHLRQLSSS